MTVENPFSNIKYDDFRRFAQDESLSKFEKIGFPDSYRAKYEKDIFSDIKSKLTLLDSHKKNILDIGPGCSDLPRMLIDLCRVNGHVLNLVDNAEMLSLLPDDSFINKFDALYPNCSKLNTSLEGKADVILCYSVLQYILLDVGFFHFLDSALNLLAPKGQFLIGDIPNVSKRKRFFASETGVLFHKNFMNTDESPVVEFNKIEKNLIDDSIIFAILQRARLQGFDAYVLPQNHSLPMANRREDILILRP